VGTKPTYHSWDEVPPGLKSFADLRFAGLEPRGEVAAYLRHTGGEIPLYLEVDAVLRTPRPGPTRGSIDPSRSSNLPPGSAGSRAGGMRRDLVSIPALGSLAAGHTPAKPAASATPDAIRALLKAELVVIDTETTGIGYSAEIVEIGVIDARGEPLLSTLVRPKAGVIPAAATRIHGISTADVREAPTFDEVYGALLAVTAGKRILAWNAPFDERMVRQSATRWGRRERIGDFECAMRAYAQARGLPGGRAKLERAAVETGVLTAATQRHRAIDDALLTLQVLMRVAGGR
jgi:DNA polymerase III subunit epsilon